MSGDHNELSDFSCELCGESFGSGEDVRSHCRTRKHRFVLLSDEEHPWKHRPPPRRTPKEEFSICQSHQAQGKCQLGDQCCKAHGDSELNEWRERLDFRRAVVTEVHKTHVEGYQEYVLGLLWHYSRAKDAAAMQQIMTESLQGLSLACKQPLKCTVSFMETELLWNFELRTITPLQRVVLLRDACRSHFQLKRLRVGPFEFKLAEGSQEWVNSLGPSSKRAVYLVQVALQASMYGTFQQTLVFDFGSDPVLTRNLSVDVVPPDMLDDIKQRSRRLIETQWRLWSPSTVDVVPFAECRSASAQSLCDMFPAPDPEVFQLTHSIIRGGHFSRVNYKARMHELLGIEEMARADIIARRYNGRASLRITANPTEATYAQGGELFACMSLNTPVTEDTDAGRLLLHSCRLVWLSPVLAEQAAADRSGMNKRRVYELPIHLIHRHCVYIRLTKQCVQEFELKPRTSFKAEVQFQLDRLPLCRMHYAVERLLMTSLVFPDFRVHPSPCPPDWEDSWDPRLNEQQRRAVAAIVSPFPVVGVAPILVEGPCGTGKTFALAQALIEVIGRQPSSRVLVCTHSKGAADLFVLDYLEKEVADRPALRPLCIVDEYRMPDRVDHRLLPYCLEVPRDQQSKEGPWFRQPTSEEVEAHRVVVTTLCSSQMLLASGLNRGFFTHIFIEEAAQAMEAECILPLALADETTRIVLAGDCMQLSPEVFSPFARERHLDTSLLQRLHSALSHHPLRGEGGASPHPCRIALADNCRSHGALARFASDAFYGGDLRAAAPPDSPSAPHHHPEFYPLSFFAVRGIDQDQGCTSTSYCNRKEADKVCDVVKQLAESWPETWGQCDFASIAVVTPYYDQVQYIRTELRNQKLPRVRVETVANVQGKEFRAVILSTVRVRATCVTLEHAAAKCLPEGVLPLNFGFLSDVKALNTALSRAQSLVVVVGDPITLCSVGSCRTVWENFITTCAHNNSLHGMGWKEIKSALDGLERHKECSADPQVEVHPLPTRRPETRAGLTVGLGPGPALSVGDASGRATVRGLMAARFESMLLGDDDDDGDDVGGDKSGSVGTGAQAASRMAAMGGLPREKSAVSNQPASRPRPSWPLSQSAGQASSSRPKKQAHEDSGRAAPAGQRAGNGMPRREETGTAQPGSWLHNRSRQSSSSSPPGRRPSQAPRFRGNRPAAQAWRTAQEGGRRSRPSHMAASNVGPTPLDERPTVAYVSPGGEGVKWERQCLLRNGSS